MLASILILALASGSAPCSLSDGTLPPNSTFADQFSCYKNAGIKVSIPGTVLVHGGIMNGAGCILGVAADRIEVGECGRFPRTKFTIQYSSIRAVVDVPQEQYVVVELTNTNRPVQVFHERPRPQPTPAPRPEPAQSLDRVRAEQAKP
jgi:hypothetical protein